MDLKIAIKKLIQLTDEEFSWYHMNSDPIVGKIDLESRKEIIDKSLNCGYEQADLILNQIELRDGKPDLIKLSTKLGIEVREEEATNARDFIYFGTYEESGIITIYLENIHKGQELLKLHGIRELSGEDFKNVILAHEIFHHIENKNKDLFVNTYRIKLWKLGPYTHRSPLLCAGEIAGMAFARRLLDLQFCPNVLDVILLYPHDKVQAEKLYDQILSYSLYDQSI